MIPLSALRLPTSALLWLLLASSSLAQTYETIVASADRLWSLQDNADSATLVEEVAGANATFPFTTSANRSVSGPTSWLPGAINFGGAHYANLPADYTTPFPYSLCWWSREESDSSNGTIVGLSSAARNLKQIGPANWRIEGAGTQPFFGLTNQRDGAWHHYAFVVDEAGVTIYFDGVQERYQANAGMTALLCNQIAADRNGTIWDGEMAQFGVWPELSADDVALLYAGPASTGPAPAKVRYYNTLLLR